MPLAFPFSSRRAALLLAGAAALTLMGCTALEPATPEQAVTARSNAYWQARVAGDYAKAYGFMTPAYRKLHSPERYRLRFGDGVAVKDAQVIKAECQEAKCSLRIKIGAAPALASLKLGTIATHLDETWLLQDGQWWLYQDL